MIKTNPNSPRGPHGVAKQRRGVKDWWTEFFDDAYGRMGLDIIDADRTAQEVDFIISALEVEKQERILDLCCGKGRHALELARRGYTGVTGLDYTEDYLVKARESARIDDLNVHFIQGDMRNIPFDAENCSEAEFDACYNFFTSFGFFQADQENEKVISSVSKALKPGGRFLIETIHRDYMVRYFRSQGWYERDGEYVLKKFDIDLAASILLSTWIYLKDGERTEREVRIRMYSLHEMIAMLRRNGLEYIQAWGNKDKESLNWEHNRMVVLARKS